MTKEGFIFPLPFILMAIVLFIIFSKTLEISYAYWASVFFFLGMLLMLFFRDPERKIPIGEYLILSPADGKIIEMSSDSETKSLSIFLSIFNVHVNRSPVKGIITSAKFKQGKFHLAADRRAREHNQRNEIEIRTEKGMVKMNQVAGAIARRIIFYKKSDQPVSAGERIGLIRFGSRVDLILPQGTEIEVKLGQKVLAGKTILGRFV